MKLSEQIADLCCGNGAINKQEAVSEALRMEKYIEELELMLEKEEGWSECND